MFNSRTPRGQIKDAIQSGQMENENLASEILMPKMNKIEAQSVLEEQLSEFVRQPYAQLAELINHPKHTTVQSPSNVQYQIEFNIFMILTLIRICASLDQLIAVAGELLCH